MKVMPCHKKYTDEQWEEAFRMRRAGISHDEISEKLGININTLKLKFQANHVMPDTKKATYELYEQIAKEFIQGATVNELADKYNRPRQAVRQSLERKGLIAPKRYKEPLLAEDLLKAPKLNQISMSTVPVTVERTRTIKAKPIKVGNETLYDVSHFPDYGLESPNICKTPQWKIELQRKWNQTNGREGVYFGIEVD